MYACLFALVLNPGFFGPLGHLPGPTDTEFSLCSFFLPLGNVAFRKSVPKEARPVTLESLR